MTTEDKNIISFEFGRFIEHVLDYCEEITYEDISEFLLEQADYYACVGDDD